MSFYISVDQIGNNIVERYINDKGEDLVRTVPYEPTLFTHCTQESEYKDIYGKNCLPKTFDTIKDCREWMQRTSGITEVLGQEDFKLAYISDRYLSDIVYDKKFIRVANFDIEVTGDEFPEPAFAKYPIDAITHYDSIDDKFYVFDLLDSVYGSVSEWDKKLAAKSEAEGGDAVPQHILDRVEYMSFTNEQEMLLEYINFWEEKTPAVLTGWNIEGFDIPYIMNRIKNILATNVTKRLSPFGKVTSKIIKDNYGNEKEVFSIKGIETLDYMDLYKKFSFTTQASYALGYISEQETNVTKLPYDGPINKLRETNHQRYISYNIVDVWCVQEIDHKRGFINLALSMGYYAKMNISSVMSPIKTWDAIIFNSLKQDKRVLPQVKHNIKEPYPGAFVKEIKPSHHKYVMSFDLTSLYPSIIRQVNISPETIAGQFKAEHILEYIKGTAPRPSDTYSCSPNGWMFRKDIDGVIPVEIKKVFDQRKDWKKKMLAAKRNVEAIQRIKNKRNGS